jgi:hypothetical protein
MTKAAGVFMQLLSIPFLVLGFVFTLVLLIGSGVNENGMATLLWPGSGYFAAFLIGVWMLKAGQRASRQKMQ